jgi:hypothetical protein
LAPILMLRITPTIIALILGIASALAMVQVYRHDLAASAAKVSSRLLTVEQLPKEQIRRITLIRDGQKLVFERGQGATLGWRQTEPFEYPMDPYSIGQIAALASELEVIDSIDPSEIENASTAAALKLDPPLAQVMYDWPNGSTTLKLGRRSVAGRAYVRIGDEPTIYVVNQRLHERALEMDPKEWRDRTIFPNADIESSQIEWTQSVGSANSAARLLMASERKQWKMLEPAKTRIDPVGRDAYLQDLGAARVSGFIFDQPSDKELAQFGLDSPVAMVTVTSDSNQTTTQRLIVGSRVPGVSQDHYGMIEGRPVIVRVSANTLGAIFRQPQHLVDPTASGVIPADVKSLIIRTADSELELQRDLERWRAPKLNNVEVNAAFVQELLNQLTQLRAPAVDFREYPRDSEVATVTFYGFDSKALDTVRIAQEKTTQRWIMENGDNVLRFFQSSVKLRLISKDFGL